MQELLTEFHALKSDISELEIQRTVDLEEIKNLIDRMRATTESATKAGEGRDKALQEAEGLRQAIEQWRLNCTALVGVLDDMMVREKDLSERYRLERERRDRGWESWHYARGNRKRRPPGFYCNFM